MRGPCAKSACRHVRATPSGCLLGGVGAPNTPQANSKRRLGGARIHQFMADKTPEVIELLTVTQGASQRADFVRSSAEVFLCWPSIGEQTWKDRRLSPRNKRAHEHRVGLGGRANRWAARLGHFSAGLCTYTPGAFFSPRSEHCRVRLRGLCSRFLH